MEDQRVSVTVSPLPGVTPIGVTLNYSVGNISTCLVELAPGDDEDPKIVPSASGILAELDTMKRKDEISVEIEVHTHVGSSSSPTPDKKTLKFTGVLDGVSLTNSVGAHTYQAVLKGKQQVLLEVTTLTPGLYPASIDIYKSPFTSMVVNSGAKDGNSVDVQWGNAKASLGLDYKQNPLLFYKNLMIKLLDLQLGPYEEFIGRSKMLNAETALRKVFGNDQYKAAIEAAKDILDTIDMSAVTGGYVDKLSLDQPQLSSVVKNFFFSGPNILLENYKSFLEFMGCTMVFSNDKIFIVPINSFIKQESKTPAFRKLQDAPNVAYPADYTNYVYSDNGYRDIAHVIISGIDIVSDNIQFASGFEDLFIGEYHADSETTQATGVLVMKKHPFMFYSNSSPMHDVIGNAKAKKMFDDPDKSPHAEPLSYSEAESSTEADKAEERRVKARKEADKAGLGGVLTNFAEQKFYQYRYGDRQGSLTTDFNPNWVPGANGVLYIRATDMFLQFFVNSVTHRIELNPPTAGTAITVISFNCGRMGKDPIGITKDGFLGFDRAKEKAFQKAFLKDITK